MTTAGDVSVPFKVELRCPVCGGRLIRREDSLGCSDCESAFPVVGGIPRLVQQDFYWGEIERESAARFLEEAREMGWREAVLRRFSPGADARISILDWQRASWTPLLALNRDAVVLDVGSGYGAITHTLAQTYGEVHSIEAIPERVEFTQVRLAQEGIKNVRLTQASALALPFAPESFDLIVVNGVLEWIGDWDLLDDPRSAQLRFLKRVHSLLKPNGTLMVGIENRIGYDSFMGTGDHSGLPYTNLLPRKLATIAVRLFSKKHHRTEQPPKAYRTFTYSEKGYRKLFSEAGFGHTAAYWAEPGYNQPYRLTPLDNKNVRRSVLEGQLDPSNRGAHGITAGIKRALAHAGVLKLVVPEFVFVIRMGNDNPMMSANTFPVGVSEGTTVQLSTFAFAPKTTLRIEGGRDHALLKTSTPAPDSKELLRHEEAMLQAVSDAVAGESSALPFLVPRPLGSTMIATQLVIGQSLLQGTQLSIALLSLNPSRRLELLRRVLPSIVASARWTSKSLPSAAGLRESSEWLAAVRTAVPDILSRRQVELKDKNYGSRAHGDLTIENVLVDNPETETPRLAIVDWESIVDGVPVFYDLYVFLASLAPLVPVALESDRRTETSSERQYERLFLENNDWATAVIHALWDAAQSMELSQEQVLDGFADSMLLRAGFLLQRNSNLADYPLQIAKSIERDRSAWLAALRRTAPQSTINAT